MRDTNIKELNIIPEQHASGIYELVEWETVYSEMSEGDRRFINGLIQYYMPERVLELGVSAGGGTVNILNSLINTDNNDWKLFSIDSMTSYYRNVELPVGYCAIERYSDKLSNSWVLIAGGDPAREMESIGEKFDFCVLDTDHRHPIETINFISILPWLKDGAIVVTHDTSLFAMRWEPSYHKMFAPRLLLSVVCAEKLIPNLPSWTLTASNIAAWQVSQDTRKYCQNLFDILYFPWEVNVSIELLESIGDLVKQHYGSEMLYFFHEAARINKAMLLANANGVLSLEQAMDSLESDTVIYGAGAVLQQLMKDLLYVGIEFNFPIWDIDAESINEIEGYRVLVPDFETPAKPDQSMIITIENEEVAKEVRNQFEPLGYRVFHGLKSYFTSKSHNIQ